MSRVVATLVGALVLAVSFSASIDPAPGAQPSEGAQWIIVGFREPVATEVGDGLLGGTVRGVMPEVRAVAIQGADVAALYAMAKADPRVRYVEYDGPGFARLLFEPDDPVQGYTVDVTNLYPAWDATRGSTEVQVAVIDSGLNRSHEEFRFQSRFVDGYDFISHDPVPEDRCGHGSAVAGVLGAPMNNALGIPGVAQVSIWSYRAFNETCLGTIWAIGQAMTQAAHDGADIESLSFKTWEASMYLNDIIDHITTVYDTLLVAAAGNDGRCSDCVAHPWKERPDKVVVVSGTDNEDTFWAASSQGPEVDLAAPAHEVMSVYYSTGLHYFPYGGTSFSAPQVAGVAALLKSVNPAANASQIAQRLVETADDMGTPGKDNKTGWGRLNAGRAILGFGGADLNARFSDVRGNATRIEVHVDANHGVDLVETRVGDAAWEPMTLRKGGDWFRKSATIPTDSLVQFRATNASRTSESECYEWPPGPEAAAVPCDGAPEPIRIEHRGGDATRVKANVTPAPVRVDAKDTQGVWVPMSLKPSGNWVAAFTIEAGHEVRFRATFANGTVVKSCWFTHPEGVCAT